MSGHLANPPVIDTDIPTNEAFYTGVPSLPSLPSHRYTPSGGAVLSLGNVPANFPLTEYRGGVAMAYQSLGSGGSGALFRIGIAPSTGDVVGYKTGWKSCGTVGSTGAYYGTASDAIIASQRQGKGVFIFTANNLDDGITFSDRLDGRVGASAASTAKVWTLDDSGNVAQVQSSTQSGGSAPAFDVHAGTQFHVSDDGTAFAWFVEDVNDSSTWVSGWTLTQDAVLPSRRQDLDTNWHFAGEPGAHRQTMTIPQDVSGWGPFLVFPWASADYGFPELWYLISNINHDGYTDGTFTIYRSRWAKGNYQRQANVILDDDDNFNASLSRFPALNPYGYGFEVDWHKPGNVVGKIGPFGIDIINLASNPQATKQNAELAGSGTAYVHAPRFSIQRDLKRSGVLHLTMTDLKPLTQSIDNVSSLWYATSTDDGVSWSPTTMMNPPAKPVVGQISEQYRGSAFMNVHRLDTVRVKEDCTLLGFSNGWQYSTGVNGALGSDFWTQQPADSGSHASFAIVDYQNIGTASSRIDGVIFKGTSQWVGTG